MRFSRAARPARALCSPGRWRSGATDRRLRPPPPRQERRESPPMPDAGRRRSCTSSISVTAATVPLQRAAIGAGRPRGAHQCGLSPPAQSSDHGREASVRVRSLSGERGADPVQEARFGPFPVFLGQIPRRASGRRMSLRSGRFRGFRPSFYFSVWKEDSTAYCTAERCVSHSACKVVSALRSDADRISLWPSAAGSGRCAGAAWARGGRQESGKSAFPRPV